MFNSLIDRKIDKACFDILSFCPLLLIICFTETVLLYHFKGFILEIKTRQYKRKEVLRYCYVTLAPKQWT